MSMATFNAGLSDSRRARRDQRKGNRLAAMLLRQRQGSAVTGDKLFPFSVFTVPPARSDGMDHILARQSISLCDFRAAGFAAIPASYTRPSSSGPAARWMQPSTPPPPKRELFAALTIASTFIFVMSFRTIWRGTISPTFHYSSISFSSRSLY